MGHHHAHHHISSKNLGLTVFLNLFISVLQLAGGIISGSISLLSDAAHNFSDVLSLLLSFFTHKLSHKPANEQFSFGYKRAEILSALFNSLTLILIAFWLIVEAVQRFNKPVIIEANIVIYFAVASIVINILSVLLLHKDAQNNLNIKSSYLHLLTDVLTSVAVLSGGLVMKYTGFFAIDSVLSVFIAVYLIYSSYHIIKPAILILMQSTPSNIEVKALKNQITALNHVKDLKNIHLWQLNENEIFLEAEIVLNADMSVSSFEKIQQQATSILDAYNISHIYLVPKY